MADDIDLPAESLHESAGQVQPEQRTPEEEQEKAIVDEVVENIMLVRSVESAQRLQEDDDLYFEGVDQWTQEARDSRAEHLDDVSGQKIPARPTIDVNLVEQPVQRIISEARQARLAISVQPKAGLANTKMAGYYKGILRSIQADSGATEVRLWALERTAKCGRGAYEIDTDFANDGDFDVDIIYRRILDQSTVYWDVYAQRADKNDADWCGIGDWMSEAARIRRWPHKPIVPSAGGFENADHPWFSIDDNKNKSVFVVRYYKVVYTKHTLAYHPETGPMKLTEMPEAIQAHVKAGADGIRTREVDGRKIVRYIVDGTQVLEEHAWDGRWIPVIPVDGKEYNVKGKRSWKGLVTNAKNLNRGYMVTINSAVETVGSMPRSPYIMYAGQDAGFEDMWDDSPIKAYTRLYVNAMDVDGKPAPFPQRQNLEPEIQGALLLARTLKSDIASVTGQIDPSSFKLSNTLDRTKGSLDLLMRQGAAGTSNFLDNLATVSMQQEGRVMIDLIAHSYDRKGRVIGCMGEENDEETAIMLKVPFVHDKDGTPVPVPCQTCGGQKTMRPPRTLMNLFPKAIVCPTCLGDGFASEENMPAEYNGQTVQYVDLSRGEFKIAVAVGRNYQTKQEEAMSAMTQLATSAPELVPIYADLWVRSMGFSGSNEIADRIKRHNPAAQDEDKAKDVPPEFMAKFQQLQQEHQLAMQELQKATDALKTDAAKIAGQKEITAMKLEAAEGLENLKQQGKWLSEQFDNKASKELEVLRGNLEGMRLESEQKHEVLMQLLKELGDKEIERHSVSLHHQAEMEAARELPKENKGASDA